MQKLKKKKRNGFTLIEVLVASGVSLLLGLTIFNVFVQSRRALAHAIGTAELVQSTRTPMDRISAYLGAGSTAAGEDVILYPPHGPGWTNERGQIVVDADPSTWTRYIVLRTTEDFLSPTYDPNEIFNLKAATPQATHAALMDAYENDAQRVYDYIIWFEDDANGISRLPNEDQVLAVARVAALTVPGPGVGGQVTQFRSSAWASADPWADLEPAYPVRIIARRIDDMSFKRDSSALDVNVFASTTVQTAANGPQVKNYQATQRIHIPSEIMR